MVDAAILEQLSAAVMESRDDFAALLARFVRVPSVSVPPEGNEGPLQEIIADRMWEMGLEVSRVVPNPSNEFKKHPSYQEGRNLSKRPNVWGMMEGSGGGRSLLLAGHSDVMAPFNSSVWPGNDPYCAKWCDGVLAGPGSASGKAGLAAAMSAISVIKKCGIKLRGDVTVASVVDEVFFGCQGMLSLVLEGVRADGALYLAGAGKGYSLRGKGMTDCNIAIDGGQPKSVETVVKKAFDCIDSLRSEWEGAKGSPCMLVDNLEARSCVRGCCMNLNVELIAEAGADIEQLTKAFANKISGIDGINFSAGVRVLENWDCSGSEIATVVSDAAGAVWGGAAEGQSEPCGAFLLSNYGRMQTASLGREWGFASPGECESVKMDEYLDLVKMICAAIVGWCGVEG
ncbi:MAG: M20/M25/M40 family metallo-hydrolase [Planctomycetes bacterium]|nr:M20/M25/M40 family metallo-hydrolase [Planctomycetota bacterium]